MYKKLKNRHQFPQLSRKGEKIGLNLVASTHPTWGVAIAIVYMHAGARRPRLASWVKANSGNEIESDEETPRGNIFSFHILYKCKKGSPPIV
jgi:hypothetical protein